MEEEPGEEGRGKPYPYTDTLLILIRLPQNWGPGGLLSP